MEFLASDALNGRGSGTRDEWIAATYIAAQFVRLGLKPMGDDGGFVQRVEIAHTEVEGAPTLAIGAETYTHGAQMVVRSLSRGTVTGKLQHYREGDSVSADSVILLPRDAAPDLGRSLSRKAAAVLTTQSEDTRSRWSELAGANLRIGMDRVVGLEQSGPQPPSRALQIILDNKAYEAVAAMTDGTAVSFVAQTRNAKRFTWNVLAALPGRDAKMSQEAILLSAHLDHLGSSDANPTGVADTRADRIYNGADDDASGVTAVLALAEALARGKPPRRTILFALFGSEESGGAGSKWVVEHPPVPLERLVANLEFEMIGRPDSNQKPNTLWLTGWERSNLGPELAKHGAKLVGDPYPQQNFFMRSDNITLARRGVIAQTISSYSLHGEYHRPSDDLAHIDFGHMTQAVQSMIPSVRWLANSGFKPEWRPGGRPQ